MGLVLNTNIPAINASNILNENTKALKKTMAKLSSGYKINSAADDASGLAVSEDMRIMITTMNQGVFTLKMVFLFVILLMVL